MRQWGLDAAAHRQQRFVQTSRPFPVGMRQHAVAQQMRIRLASNRNPQFCGMSPVSLDYFPRPADLVKMDLLGRPVG